MTPDKTPTEALSQLRHLYANLTNGEVRDTASAKRIAEGLLSPAIAALEKWGSPAVAGEPVAWRHRVGPADHWVDCSKEFHDWVLREPKTWPGDEVQALCLATPQPTQAQAGAVPLTEEQIGSLACADSLSNIEVPALQWLVREVEYLHGIKGGQHG